MGMQCALKLEGVVFKLFIFFALATTIAIVKTTKKARNL
jgi:hypothetical protein